MSYDATWDAMQAGTKIRSLTMPLGNEPTREMEETRTTLDELTEDRHYPQRHIFRPAGSGKFQVGKTVDNRSVERDD